MRFHFLARRLVSSHASLYPFIPGAFSLEIFVSLNCAIAARTRLLFETESPQPVIAERSTLALARYDPSAISGRSS
jgi:hypothetical protein